jgi:nicotinate-nucleotide pyrophosphorylase (carboxylating)
VSKLEFVQNALFEDIGRGDLFERTILPAIYRASVNSKADGIFAGREYATVLLGLFDLEYEFFVNDGDTIQKGERLLAINGLNTDVLKLERTLLNMLQHASGIASRARIFADMGAEFGVSVLDTRKTRPGLRIFEKDAARVGGVKNHRFGLDDALMIKDTHLKAIDDLAIYIKNARKKIPFTAKIEIECETVDAAKEAIRLGVDIVMCDNMLPEEVSTVVVFRNETDRKVLLECSGNIDETNFQRYAATGIDAISIGGIIHQAVWLDFSMKGGF